MSAELSFQRADPRLRKRYYFEMTPARRVITALVGGIFPAISQMQVQGVENLPDSGPAILAANHLTNFDVFPIQLALPRLIFYMGKEELFRSAPLDWTFRQLGSFPVYRGERDAWAIQHALRVLANGQVLGIFPEGSRSKGRGLRPAKAGAARLAIEAGCPIAPMAIHGTQYMFARFPHRTRVSLNLGRTIHPQRGESPEALTERLMRTLAGLLPREDRGVYA